MAVAIWHRILSANLQTVAVYIDHGRAQKVFAFN